MSGFSVSLCAATARAAVIAVRFGQRAPRFVSVVRKGTDLVVDQEYLAFVIAAEAAGEDPEGDWALAVRIEQLVLEAAEEAMTNVAEEELSLEEDRAMVEWLADGTEIKVCLGTVVPRMADIRVFLGALSPLGVTVSRDGDTLVADAEHCQLIASRRPAEQGSESTGELVEIIERMTIARASSALMADAAGPLDHVPEPR